MGRARPISRSAPDDLPQVEDSDSEAAYLASMRKPLTCWIGFHAWHPIIEEDHLRLIQCLRCGKKEQPNGNVALRFGYDNYMGNH